MSDAPHAAVAMPERRWFSRRNLALAFFGLLFPGLLLLLHLAAPPQQAARPTDPRADLKPPPRPFRM